MFWLILLFVSLTFGNKTICPGGEHKCTDSTTCCQLPDKSYGCCPLKNAVCCDDNIHCCPQGTKCSVGMCIQSSNLNATAYKLNAKVKNHPCPTEESSCPDDYTCCSNTEAGIYGCCPLQDAVCCSDASHCCPMGTVCDLVMERCVGKDYVSLMYDSRKEQYKSNLEMLNFAAITMKAKKFDSVVCPGEEFQCPDGYTCCKLPTGNWGCCPFVKATCCNDHMHCCPEGLKCDVTSKTCLQGTRNVTWSLNTPATKISDADVICPDHQHCLENTTCCQLESGNYGCCPYDNAVCCSDHSHCCPSGYRCDVHKKKCLPHHKYLDKTLPEYETNYV